jgi:hypothetical protein
MKNLYFQQIYQCSAELLNFLEEKSGIPLEEDSNSEKYCIQYFGGSKYKKSLDEHLANLNDEFRGAKSKLIVFICKEHEEDLFTWYLISYSPDGLPELMKLFLEVFPTLCDKVSSGAEMVACERLSQWSKIKSITGQETTQVLSEGQFRYYCSVLDVIKIKNGEYICGKYLITSYISDVKPEDRYLQAAEGNDDRRVLSSEWFIQPVVDNQEEGDNHSEKEEKKAVAAGKRLRSNSSPQYLYSVYSDFSHDEDVGHWATNIDKHSLKEYQTVLQEVFTYEENYGDSEFYLYYMHVN